MVQRLYVDDISSGSRARRLLWEYVYLVFFRPTPRFALEGWRRFLLRAFGARIGKGSRIAPSCKVWAPWNLQVGNYTSLADGVDCYTQAKIVIGNYVTVSQRAFLCTGTHDTSKLANPLVVRPITIGDHVWVAAEVMVAPGVTIGSGAVVSARSFVNRDLPDWMVCAGMPCKPVKERVVDRRSISTP